MVQWGFAGNYPEFASKIMMSLFFLSLSFPPQQLHTTPDCHQVLVLAAGVTAGHLRPAQWEFCGYFDILSTTLPERKF